jgi:hypothetical protein
MTTCHWENEGIRRRLRRLLIPSLFFPADCHPERSEGSRQNVVPLKESY